MNITIENSILKVLLESECTITHVIQDHNALALAMKTNPKKIELTVSGVDDIDTAYFQLLISLKRTAQDCLIPFELNGKSDKIAEICAYYGVSIY